MLSIVVGSIIGAGIFMLPVSLAPLGWNAALGWIVSGSGALCLAFALGSLSRGGRGIQVHIDETFGPIPAYIAAWGFWCGAWTSTPALAIAASSALSRLNAQFGDAALVTLIAISFVIALTAVNALGIRSAGRMQILTTAIKIIPLLAVILIVLLRAGRGQVPERIAATPRCERRPASRMRRRTSRQRSDYLMSAFHSCPLLVADSGRGSCSQRRTQRRELRFN
jgi:APA family basic amino acid/polyamine antiporter